MPAGVVPGFGGLDVELSSTAMVGLGEGARYLVEYPYGCVEQKVVAIAGAAAGRRPRRRVRAARHDPGQACAPTAQRTLKELETFQCESGGFAYWPGACQTVSPYLTAYVLHVFKAAGRPQVQRRRRRPRPRLRLPAARAGGDAAGRQRGVVAGLHGVAGVRGEGARRRRPQPGLAPHAALRLSRSDAGVRAGLPARRDGGQGRDRRRPRLAELRRRMANAILPEGGSAHVEELTDPYLLWFWNSNVRSTAIVLNSLVTASAADAPLRPMVRWLMAARKNGRWGNTQENAHAMEALVGYYRKYEATTPDFRAVVKLGARELARDEFHGRSTRRTRRACRCRRCWRRAGGRDGAADVRARGRRARSSTPRGCATRPTRCDLQTASTPASGRAHATSRTSRAARRPAAHARMRPATWCA